MADTQLKIVNRVLRRLRENTVASIGDTEYSQLIADFLNQTVEEVGNEHNWSIDRKQVALFISADSGKYWNTSNLNDGGADLLGEGLKSPRATPYLDPHGVPLCYAGYDTLSLTQIPIYYSPEAFERYKREGIYNGGPISRQDDPDCYMYRQTGSGWSLEIHPGVDREAAYYVQSYWYDPDTPKEVDGSEETETFRYDAQLLTLGTLLLALNERGEELGEPGNMAERQYERALSDAIYTDSIATQIITNNLDWRRD